MQAEQMMTPGPAPGGLGDDGSVRVMGAVRWVFSDREWTKSVLLGVVFMLLPIVGPIALAGWMCEIHQRLVRGHPRPMPKLDFNDFTHYLSRGLAPFLVQLAIMLPTILIVYALAAAAGFAAFFAAKTSGEPAVIFALALVVMLFALGVWLVLSVLLNAAQTRAELTEDAGQSLSLSKLMEYSRATWKTVMWKHILFGFVAFGIMLCGLVLCYFGLYPAAVVMQLAALALRFQIYRGYVSKGGEAIAVKAQVTLPSEARMQPPAAYAGY